MLQARAYHRTLSSRSYVPFDAPIDASSYASADSLSMSVDLKSALGIRENTEIQQVEKVGNNHLILMPIRPHFDV